MKSELTNIIGANVGDTPLKKAYAGTELIWEDSANVSNGLILNLDVTDPSSYPGTGTTWFDISGNGNDFTWNSVGLDADGYFTLGSKYVYNSTNLSTSTGGTLVIWMKSTDVQALFLSANNNGSQYVGAYRVDNKEYYGNSGSPNFYIDTTEHTNIYDNFPDGKWHMVEFKNVDLSGWPTHRFNGYTSGYHFTDGVVGKIMYYDRVLTAEESLSNYNTDKPKFSESLIVYLDADNISSYPGSGTTWYDLSGYGNDATLSNVTTDTALSGSLYFNGSTSVATIPFHSSMEFDNEYTLIMCLKSVENDSNRRNPINQAYGGGGTITHEPNDTMNYYCGTSGGNAAPYVTLSSTASITKDEPVIIAVTRDSGSRNFFKNGVKVSTGSGYTAVTGTQDILIGDGYAGNFLGNVAYVKIYKRKLSDQEILDEYNQELGRLNSTIIFNLDATNTASYPGTGTTWYDLSGNGIHGTIDSSNTFNSATGGSFKFYDLSSSGVSLSNSLLAVGTGDFTIETFAFDTLDGDGSFRGIFSSMGTNSSTQGVSLSRDKYWLGFSGLVSASMTNNWPTGRWTQVTLTRESGVVKLYFDGVYQNQATESTITNFNSTVAEIGHRYATNFGYGFGGYIGIVRYYNVALTESKILANYNADIGKFSGTIPGSLTVSSSSYDHDSIDLSWTASSDADYYEVLVKPPGSGAFVTELSNTTLTTYTYSATPENTYSFIIKAHNAYHYQNSNTLTITTLGGATPTDEDFETTTWAQWSQSTTDDLDWTRRTGSTPSGNTGPTGAFSGNYYLFTEASSPNFNKTFILDSTLLAITSSQRYFNFAYHMYGANMGTLNLKVSTDGSVWTTLWTMTGNQGIEWFIQEVDLNAYINNNIYLRFEGITGSNYDSDMCIDDIRFKASTGTNLQPSTSTWPDQYITAYTTRVTNDGGVIEDATWLNSDITSIGQTVWENNVFSHISAAGGYKVSTNQYYSIDNQNDNNYSDGTVNIDRRGLSFNRPAYLLQTNDVFTHNLNPPTKNDYSIFLNASFFRNGAPTLDSYVYFYDGGTIDDELRVGVTPSGYIEVSTAAGYFNELKKWQNLSDSDYINMKILLNVYDTTYECYLNGELLGTGNKFDYILNKFSSSGPYYQGYATADLYQVVMLDGIRSSAEAIAMTTR
jgi:hypothetical protein